MTSSVATARRSSLSPETTTTKTAPTMSLLPGALYSADSVSSNSSGSSSSSSSQNPSSSSDSSFLTAQKSPITPKMSSFSTPRQPSISSSSNYSGSRSNSVASASSSRRPSEVRRVPVPRLSNAEQQLLAVHNSTDVARRSGSIASLQSQKREIFTLYPDVPTPAAALFSSIPFNSSSGTSGVGQARRPSGSSGPLSLKTVSTSPIGVGAGFPQQPAMTIGNIAAQSRKASFDNNNNNATSQQQQLVSYENENHYERSIGEEEASSSSIFSSSISSSAFATPATEIAAYRFPLPPSANNTPVMPTFGHDEGRFEEIQEPEQVLQASPRKASIPQEVMDDCGCGGPSGGEEEDSDSDSDSGEDLTAENEDTLPDMTATAATPNLPGDSNGENDVRLSHYRWQSLDNQSSSGIFKRTTSTVPMYTIPHSRSVTEDTDVALFSQGSPSLEQERLRSQSQLGSAFSPNISLSSSTFNNGLGGSPTMTNQHVKSDSVDSTVDSIFDSYSESYAGSPTSARTTIPDGNGQGTAKDEEELAQQREEQQRVMHGVGKRLSTVQEGGHSRFTTEDSTQQGSTSTGSDNSASTNTSANTNTTTSSSSSRRLRKKEKKIFNSYSKPSEDQLLNAADAMVYTENGDLVRFGDLWEGQRTIVCFIRHYWCPSCQDYMASIMRVSPEQLRALNLRLIIVGCGNWKMIAGYRKLLGGCTYPIVSDPSRAIYRQFGMTRNSMAAGKRSAYVQHGMTVNTLISLKRNLAMPLKDPGELNGLGGEFVLGPGVECSYAHRMRNTRDHAELSDILKALGIMLPLPLLYHQHQAGRREESTDYTPFSKARVEEAKEQERQRKKQQEKAEKKKNVNTVKLQTRRPSTTGSGRVVIKVVDNPALRDSSTF